ncbi:MAG: cytochrome c [Balneolaceae bacterium]|nr:cytochrome c [Balneolaceae bacterium]
MKTIQLLFATMIAVSVLVIGCGGNGGDAASKSSPKTTSESGLSEFEIKNGIGPVTEEIVIGEIDAEIAQKGAEVFELKCSACHKMNERYVGPALGDILELRTPAYVMNMILNPDGMVKKHPEAKKKLQEFMTPMPNQNLSQDEARAIAEYLASDIK